MEMLWARVLSWLGFYRPGIDVSGIVVKARLNLEGSGTADSTAVKKLKDWKLTVKWRDS